MVKKIIKTNEKKNKRSTSKVVKSKTKVTKPISKKKIVKTVTRIRRSRSMEETIKEAKQYEANCIRRDGKRRTRATRVIPVVTSPTKIIKRKVAPTKSTNPSKRVAPILPIKASVPTHSSPSKKRTVSNVSTGPKVSLKHDPTLPMAQFGVIDICFCIDATGSMTSYLAQSKKTVIDIISQIERKVQTEGVQLRFAVVTYRDHPPQDHTYVTKIQDFTDDRTIKSYISTLDATGGGDFAEAVHDGLLVSARDLSWRNYPMIPSLRYIFHIADAPPHGKQYNEGTVNGCTCGISTDAITHAINHQQIHYRLIKIGNHPHVAKMQEIFKKSMTNFQSAEISQAAEMNIKVSDMIIRQIMPL